jgi:hypothetical protein
MAIHVSRLDPFQTHITVIYPAISVYVFDCTVSVSLTSKKSDTCTSITVIYRAISVYVSDCTVSVYVYHGLTVIHHTICL